MKIPRHLLICLSLALFAVVSYFTARGQVQPLGAMDHIGAMAPMNGPEPDQPWDVLQADGAIQFYVWRDLVFESWGKGQVPGWNPYELCGTTLLANSQSAGFYPLHILMGVLHVPTRLAILLLAAFHLCVCVYGVVLLTRKLGAQSYMQWVAGIGFGYSAFLLSWIGLSSVITTCCWIPWALWGLLSVASWRDLWKVAVPVGLMFLGGHLQFVAYGMLAIGFSWFSLVAMRRPGAWMGLIGVMLGIMLATPQLLPVLDFGKNSHRRDPKGPMEDGWNGYAASALGPEKMALVAPQNLGNPDRWADVELQKMKVGDTWIPVVKGGGNYAESAYGMGVVVFLGLVLAVQKRLREKTVAAEPLVIGGVCMLVGLLMGSASPLSRLMYFYFPGWYSTGSPGRAMVLFVLGAAIVSSQASGWSPKEKPRAMALGVTALFAVVLTALTMSTVPAEVQGWVQGIVQRALPLVLGLAAVGAAVYFVARQVAEESEFPVKWAAAGALVPALFLFGAPDALKTPFLGKFEGERVAFINDHWSLWTRPKALMPGNLAALNRVREASGYDSLMDRDTFKMFGDNPTPPENGNMVVIKSSMDHSKLAEMGVTKIISADGSSIEALPGPGLAIDADVQKSEAGHVVVKAKGDVAGYRERAIQGWSATVNGAPMALQPGLWLQVVAKPGDIVEFRYEPPKMKLGLGLMLLSGLVLGAGAFAARRS